jgi:general secretion pathway protein N
VKRWKGLAVGAAAYSVALLVTAPATLVDGALRRASGGALRMAEARGSIWSGSGQLELLDPQRGNGIAKALSWRVLPGSLWRGHAVYDVLLADSAAPARVTLSPSRIEIASVRVELPASAIGIAVPRLAPARLTGELSISAARVALERRDMRGSATVRWRNAGAALTPVSPLGEYEMRIESDEQGVRATLATLSGPLELKGQGSWRGQTRPAFSGTAHVPAPYAEQIAPLLRLVAAESGDGTFQLVPR